MNNIIPIILAGGTGSRLWPLSRESYPKQFLPLIDSENDTLLQKTYKRIADLENLSKPIIICHEEHRFIVGDQMRKIKIEPQAILLEPARRNTAPATTLAALLAKDINYDPILLVLSSDHIIDDELEFCQIIRKGLNEAKKLDNRIIYPSAEYLFG